MKEPPVVEIKDNPFHTWTRVELWRWQYGSLPEPDDDRGLDVVKGLRNMAGALLNPDPDIDRPSPHATGQALEYAAHLLELATEIPKITVTIGGDSQLSKEKVDKIMEHLNNLRKGR